MGIGIGVLMGIRREVWSGVKNQMRIGMKIGMEMRIGLRLVFCLRIGILILMEIVIYNGTSREIGIKMEIMIGHGMKFGVRIETRMGTGFD